MIKYEQRLKVIELLEFIEFIVLFVLKEFTVQGSRFNRKTLLAIYTAMDVPGGKCRLKFY